MSEQGTARVGIVMGSDSDWPVMQAAAEALQEFDVAYEADVVLMLNNKYGVSDITKRF